MLVVFGTRPEAVKMGPVVRALGARAEVCVTGQHGELVREVLEAFDIVPRYDLAIMREGQTLFDVTERVLAGMRSVLAERRPRAVLVHGDTTTAFGAALAAFYCGVPVGHVEAGLRTYNMRSPFPEEFNRRAVALLARWHFAPTEAAAENLRREGIAPSGIFVTGNTAVDALATTVRREYRHSELAWAQGSRLVILTAHRRENRGEVMAGLFRAIRRVVEEHPEVKVVYPVHPNPAFRKATEVLDGCPRIHKLPPLGVLDFHNFLARSYMILTDSGGIQEEASALGKPTLVLRDTTERPEGLVKGTLRLAGTGEEQVYREFTRLLADEEAYRAMSEAPCPFGDGHAARRIAEILARELGEGPPFPPCENHG